MKRSFRIKLFREGELGKCYTVKFKNENSNEGERFKEENKAEYESYYRNIKSRLKFMLNRHKFKPPWLDLEEGKRDDRVIAVKTKSDDTDRDYGLRWYGLRCSDNILILGMGGLKTTNTYQEDEKLHKCVKDLQYVDKCLNERIASSEILFNSGTFQIEGNLNFPEDEFEHIEYPED